MEVCSQIHSPVTFLLRKELQYPKKRRVGWPQSWSTCFGEEEKLLPLLGTRNSLASAAHEMQPQTCHNMRLFNYNLK
jgi:hypothetical protein